MKISFLFFISIIIGLSVFANAQKTEDGEPPQISIPENIKQQIVRRILVFKFKPAKKQKVINLVKDDIDPSWLPEIQNVKFKLLTDEEAEEIDSDIYFFTKAEADKKNYNISFAFGDPNCGYVGDQWNFRIVNDKLRLWYAGGMGGGCFSNSDFKNPGKLNTYPNELEGYKFFDQGKLKGLKIMISTKEDVEKIFGSDCDSRCDFDDKWKIDFDYFGGISSREITVNEKKIKLVPKKDLIGTIYSITFTPKQHIPFGKQVFPRTFNESSGGTIGDGFDKDGRLSAVGTFYKTHYDRYGLKYSIYSDGYAVNAKKEDRKKGDLLSIEYSIPEKIEETTFVEEQ